MQQLVGSGDRERESGSNVIEHQCRHATTTRVVYTSHNQPCQI